MSIKAMSYVWENSKASGSELLLLLAICDHAADDGYCWPSIETLAKKIRMSTRSVMRFIQSLEERGELHAIRDNRNNRYVITMGRTAQQIEDVLSARKEVTGKPKDDNLTGDNLSRDNVVTSICDTCVTSIGDKGVTLIINEPSIESSSLSIENAPQEKPNGQAHFVALSRVCKVDLKLMTEAQRQQLGQSSKLLKKAGVLPEQIERFGKYWYGVDWRGKKGQVPTPAQVRAEWGKFKESGYYEEGAIGW